MSNYIIETKNLTKKYKNQKVLDSVNIKVEKGNKPTDWTPAPEDLVIVSGTELQIF